MGDSRPNVAMIACLVGMVALAAANFYTISNLRAVESRVVEVQAEQAKAKTAISAEMEKVRAAATQNATDRQKTLAAVRTEMEQARDQARGIAGRVKEEALKGVQDINARLTANEQRIRESQVQINGELRGLREATDSTKTHVAAVSTEIREVRDEVAATRGQLNATIADLKRVTGDLGVMSGLIATNGKEIGALKELGDRIYSEFTVRKTRDAVRIGDVWVTLKGADPGKHRYTIEVRADDRKIEKKDRGLNEPVQFFVGHNRQPHELVVNQIHKNQIVGYLAAPKVTVSAR
jgi:hypothetical protein